MSVREKNILFVLFLLLFGLTLESCKNDDNENEETLPLEMEVLPSAENVTSTSAYIPVENPDHQRWNLELLVGMDENLIFNTTHPVRSLFLPVELDKKGFEIKYLEPSCTYYYTMIYHKGSYGEDDVFAKEIKSFTTQGVSIQFIDQGENHKLRVKVFNMEDEDAYSSLNVIFYGVNEQGDIDGLFEGTNYIGNGIWEQDYYHAYEGDRWKAEIKCPSGRVVAETPIITFVDGKWKVGETEVKSK